MIIAAGKPLQLVTGWGKTLLPNRDCSYHYEVSFIMSFIWYVDQLGLQVQQELLVLIT